MQLIYEDLEIIEKTRGLCQTIVTAPEFKTIQERIMAFMCHDQAQRQYRDLSQKRDLLNQKQEQGLTLSQEEMADFEEHREAFLNNPVAKDFLDAQEELHEVKKLVTQYVSKTLELGRLPGPEEMETGSCGSGCGCHH